MKYCRTLRLSLAVLSGLSLTGYSLAATVARYTFDTMADATDTPVGQQVSDSSGNNFHITRGLNSGVFGLTQDIRSVGPNPPPSGSLALYQGGSALNDSPASSRFSLAQTGELSVEFWWKPEIADTVRYVICFPGSTGDKNSWGIYQSAPSDTGKFGLNAFFYDGGISPITFPELSTGKIFDTDGISAVNPQWHHVAVTVDAAKTGKMYLDGNLVSTKNYAGANYQPVSNSLRIGASSVGNFAGSFRLDDLRVSDVALPAGSGTGVNELAWHTTLSTAPNPGPRPPNLGKLWVRSHALMLSAWGGASDVAAYSAANFNTALTNRSGYHYIANGGVDTQMLGGFLGFDDSVVTELNIASNAPRLTSYMLRDEIPIADIPDVAQQAAYIRSIDSNRIIVAGLGSSDPSYIDNVVANVQPDALVHGFYPWQGATSATDELNGMLEDWVPVRQKALQYGLPAIAYVQSFDDLVSGGNGVNDNRRLPSESELRVDVFSHLSAGVQGLIYYVADARNVGAIDKALINPDGSQSPLYAPAQQLNAEVAKLGRSLRYLTSSDWRFVSGGVSSNPVGIPNWASGAGSINSIASIAVNGTPTAGKDGLVGFFADDNGGRYFMLTNLTHAEAGSSSPTSATFTVNFSGGLTKIFRLNRLSGEPERVDLTASTLNLTLSGGTGDLFRMGDGFFAGILPGDANLDGTVSSTDFNLLAANYGGNGKRWGLGDFNLDDKVTTLDFNYLAGHFGSVLSSDVPSLGATVPEPGAVSVIALAASLLLKRNRPQRMA